MKADRKKTDDIVQIKLTPPQRDCCGEIQNAAVYAEGRVIWEGQVGDIAEICFEKPTAVEIKYHACAAYFGGDCIGIIDPSKGRNYCVYARQGFLKTVMELQRTNYIDTD